MEVSNIYLFHVWPPSGSPYIEQFVNTHYYWKTVRDAQAIVEARVPAGSNVTYYGTN